MDTLPQWALDGASNTAADKLLSKGVDIQTGSSIRNAAAFVANQAQEAAHTAKPATPEDAFRAERPAHDAEILRKKAEHQKKTEDKLPPSVVQKAKKAEGQTEDKAGSSSLNATPPAAAPAAPAQPPTTAVPPTPNPSAQPAPAVRPAAPQSTSQGVAASDTPTPTPASVSQKVKQTASSTAHSVGHAAAKAARYAADKSKGGAQRVAYGFAGSPGAIPQRHNEESRDLQQLQNEVAPRVAEELHRQSSS